MIFNFVFLKLAICRLAEIIFRLFFSDASTRLKSLNMGESSHFKSKNNTWFDIVQGSLNLQALPFKNRQQMRLFFRLL